MMSVSMKPTSNRWACAVMRSRGGYTAMMNSLTMM